MKKLTAKRLRSILDIDLETGECRWRWRTDISRRSNLRWAGKIAGTPHNAGYVQIRIDGKRYLRHRLIWLAAKGRWPKDEVDHKNLIRNDDRIKNLREATSAQNRFNHKIYSTNTSGKRGVHWHRKNRNWVAVISIKNKPKHLGSFKTKTEAHAAYVIAAINRGGEFARAA